MVSLTITMLLVEPTLPLLLTVHNYFADPGCRLENIKAAPGSRISFVSFCRSGGNTNCFDMLSQNVDMRYVIMIHHGLFCNNNLFSRRYYPHPVIAFPLQRPMIFKGLVFHQIQRQLCHKKDQVFRLPFKV